METVHVVVSVSGGAGPRCGRVPRGVSEQMVRN